MFSLRIYFKGVTSAATLGFATKQDRDGFFRSLGSAMRSDDSERFCWDDGIIVTNEIRMIEKI